jgi:hypothetical protein
VTTGVCAGFQGAPASANSTFYAIDGDRVMNYFLIYHFFGLLWTNQFIQGFGVCVIAGATCGWYFSTNDAGSPDAAKFSFVCPVLSRCLFWFC